MRDLRLDVPSISDANLLGESSHYFDYLDFIVLTFKVSSKLTNN